MPFVGRCSSRARNPIDPRFCTEAVQGQGEVLARVSQTNGAASAYVGCLVWLGNDLTAVSLEVRRSYFVGQSEGKVKVYFEWL